MSWSSKESIGSSGCGGGNGGAGCQSSDNFPSDVTLALPMPSAGSSRHSASLTDADTELSRRLYDDKEAVF